MHEIEVKTFEEFHRALPGASEHGFCFRGVPDCDNHALVPSVGRYLNKLAAYGQPEEALTYFEATALDVFEMEGRPFFEHEPRTKWEVIALAQHYGVPTRLLDWSRNPLVALYFALDGAFSCDAAVYATQLLEFADPLTSKGSPLEVDRIFGLAVSHLTPRLNAQSGMFTIQPDPRVPLPLATVHRIRIKAASRLPLLRVLFNYGIHQKSMFPDLAGLGGYIRRLKFEPWDAV